MDGVDVLDDGRWEEGRVLSEPGEDEVLLGEKVGGVGVEGVEEVLRGGWVALAVGRRRWSTYCHDVPLAVGLCDGCQGGSNISFTEEVDQHLSRVCRTSQHFAPVQSVARLTHLGSTRLPQT